MRNSLPLMLSLAASVVLLASPVWADPLDDYRRREQESQAQLRRMQEQRERREAEAERQQQWMFREEQRARDFREDAERRRY